MDDEPEINPGDAAMIKGCIEYVRSVTEPLKARILELEAREQVKFAGAWRSGAAFAKGSLVVYGGSLWIAKKDSVLRPNASEDFQLVVKKGSFSE
jgi:hypothetical protein